jgi:hypothetical protein
MIGNHWTWCDEWRHRLKLPGDALDATVVEAWAKFRWSECRHLKDDARMRILGYILNILARAWGTDIAVRDAVRQMLTLRDNNPELVERFGPPTSPTESAQ